MALVMVTAPVAPDTLMPLPATLEVTPLLVMASGPPKICRVELSSDMPVPAVTMPVVEATIKPSESVESAAFLVLVSQTLFDALSCVVDIKVGEMGGRAGGKSVGQLQERGGGVGVEAVLRARREGEYLRERTAGNFIIEDSVVGRREIAVCREA